ncbi:DNA-binding LacI/PurR family transcriptional regulator [Dyadobacter jejuensis]|uniref:DNA-binding LacI/PurR family transcriptional regulator n=1 Tax=Dyadobacter jejuensis TaxID=1082580 RepID=A0A316A9G1_9BACT|nr:GntR family transcriptional regulator [Dyadobacter jejuensis]PWJ54059.1 DNA-binding LacI/PurR family transcriptional regulator [Dyadobacter jejuensis]
MTLKISINTLTEVPVYKQLIRCIESLVEEGTYQNGDFLPSMNELSQELSISKETVKKAYSILRDKGLVESAHGKGFYITHNESDDKTKVLMLFDKLSTYKFVLYSSFTEHVGEQVNMTIHLHNQDPDIFETLLEENLGRFDYYIITAHFSQDPKVQDRILKLLKKVPNRKLILLDSHMGKLRGNYGAVYQDFEKDVYKGLLMGMEYLKKYNKIHVLAAPGSLYAHMIQKGISKFCTDHTLDHEMHQLINHIDISPGDVYLVLNSQLDIELIELIRKAKSKNLKIGQDIGIISYNEAPINEIILDGLTVLSTDFQEMGKLAAEMVITGKLTKINNPFGLIVRKTL